MRRAIRRPVLPLIAATLGILLAATGCSITLPQRSGGLVETPTTGTPATAAQAAPADTAPTSAQLVAALPTMPAGATPWAAKFGPFGALNAGQFVGLTFGPANVTKDLPIETRRGLEFGAVQRWNQSNGLLVSVFFARYATNSGALSAFLQQRSNEQLHDVGDPHFTVPGVQESYATEIAKLDSVGNAQTDLHEVAGNVLVRVFTVAPATPDETDTTQLAQQAYTSLCGITDCSSSGS